MSSLALCMNTKNEVENLRAVFNCVESVISEIVVVDCASTDGTRELARKLNPFAHHHQGLMPSLSGRDGL